MLTAPQVVVRHDRVRSSTRSAIVACCDPIRFHDYRIAEGRDRASGGDPPNGVVAVGEPKSAI